MHTQTAGYGERTVASRKWLAHRFVMAQLYGEDAIAGKIVYHTCDNKLCINPEHLRIGTHADNMADMKAKGRGRNQNKAKSHCKLGHEFTEENTWVSKDGRRYCRACWAVKRGSNASRSRRSR